MQTTPITPIVWICMVLCPLIAGVLNSENQQQNIKPPPNYTAHKGTNTTTARPKN